jgi:hypothetical protein
MCKKENKSKYNKEYSTINKEIIKERKRLYYIANKEKFVKYESNRTNIYYPNNKAKRKAYLDANKEKIAEQKKAYYNSNKEKIVEYNKQYGKNRKLIDPLFKLKSNIRTLIGNSIRRNGYKKLSKTELILGCSFEQFKIYLESRFEDWMSWENRGLYNGTERYGWDIDHIIPIDTAKDEIELVKLNHYSNLQPLCSKVNRDIKKHTI